MSSSFSTNVSSKVSRDGRIKPRRDSNSSQTAKKRELDRIAQKKSRERTRNRMLELEEKLERLQSDDKQKQISDLLRVVDELKRENERLQGIVDRVRGLVSDSGNSVNTGYDYRGSSPPNHSDENQQQYQNSLTTSSSGEALTWWDVATSSESPESMNIEDNSRSLPLIPETPSASLDPGLQHHSVTNQFPMFDLASLTGLTSYQSSLTCGTPGQPGIGSSVVPDIDKWHTSNSAFIFGINSGKKGSFNPSITTSLSAYKAILWGCNEAEEKERSHPFWLALRQVDEKVFGNWTSKAQKIAIMFVSHRMLLYQTNPCKETLERVPTFLRPRPSQETIQHPAVIDFLIWPGLRDRLVFSHKHYTSTGDFSAAFCQYLHFHWPFSDDEILIFDRETKAHKLNPLFEKYSFDLKNWTMDEGFFEKFVEMKYDIPATKCENGLEKLFDYMPMTA
ncbi:uncharacterized protein PAC_19076 [Phialocephala subalpina]|uniref:BZIP domain-containing protein n=1 Tax=Phialocephala subalpina TaxID=576137 RepID=A0A1L7XVX3_9HELO|nr:uncharacterized protein PAC_19076 [Phialocephala subalpina]